MTRAGARHSVQRSNRVRLKADTAVLLKRLVGLIDGNIVDGSTVDDLRAEIAEIQIRLHPPSGAAAPVKLTAYTDNKGQVKRAVPKPPTP